MKAILIDFDDSFTFNLVQFFEKLEIKISVFHWSKVSEINLSKYKLVIIGPGPGKPNDYKNIFKFLKPLITFEGIKVIGVCLGHQILLSLFGEEISRLKHPIHGQSKEIVLNSYFSNLFEVRTIKTQFYNSLYFDYFKIRFQKGEFQNYKKMVVIFKYKNVFSMQFHPESIGTIGIELGIKKFLR